MINHISVAIIVKNGANTLKNTLDSLGSFSDVVVYDNGSTDGTQDIVKSYSNTHLIEGEFLGFGDTKNKAASFTKNDWILSLDADEVVAPELAETLQTLTLDNNSVYSLTRFNFYKQRHIKHCWGNDILIRLYNKSLTSFTRKKVHETIISDGLEIVKIRGVLNHFSYSSISDFITKLDKYSSLYAVDNQGKKSSSPLKAVVSGIFSFIKTYFFKRGFLDGMPGLIIAFSHMATNFYKYIKLYEINNESK
ncbi:MAG: glycosyltransferase [Methylophaga sp.]|nr:glycosyltransferase [Methylophaga sp.]